MKGAPAEVRGESGAGGSHSHSRIERGAARPQTSQLRIVWLPLAKSSPLLPHRQYTCN
jgi:hypothetical protein